MKRTRNPCAMSMVLRLVFPSGPPDARWVSGFALAQVAALLTATSAIASTALVNRGANLPAWQSFFVYALLAAFYVPAHAHQRARERVAALDVPGRPPEEDDFGTAPQQPSPDGSPDGRGAAGGGKAAEVPASRSSARYAALSVIDTQANYLIVQAFRYTSLTSVTLLDCAAIPFSMALSRAALGGAYARGHVAGGVVSISGLAILVLADVGGARGSGEGGANPPLGDFLVLCAALLYAASNVLQEAALLDGASTAEVLARIGGFGAIVSGAQCLALEYEDLSKLRAAAGPGGVLELATFAVSLFAMYSLVPEVLRRCGAAAFNVAMLSSDLWAAAARVAFFGGFGGWIASLSFFASLVTVAAGLVMFAAAGDPLPPGRKGAAESRYSPLDEEIAAVVADLETDRRGDG